MSKGECQADKEAMRGILRGIRDIERAVESLSGLLEPEELSDVFAQSPMRRIECLDEDLDGLRDTLETFGAVLDDAIEIVKYLVRAKASDRRMKGRRKTG